MTRPAVTRLHGDPTAILPRHKDPTRRLEQCEELYRTILDSLSEAVLITDEKSRILYANRKAEQLTGYAQEELADRVSHELLAPREEWPAMRKRLRERLAGEEDSYEHEMVVKGGARHWVQVRAVPYRDARGRIAGTIGLIACIADRKSLELEKEYLAEEVRRGYSAIVGDSPALHNVLSQVELVAPTAASVLITGESGTGKELVARAIHERSPRRHKPLVRVNCAAIPRELFESELFGHVRGAFTGAVKDRVGRFELADGGTLFLDEIGEMPLDLQVKLLRALQEKEIERVGEERSRPVDVRVISATNRDLEADTKAGTFRLDLYYRLAVFPIAVPPLRERPEDIRALSEHFLRASAERLGVPPPRLDDADLQELRAYAWPGNVRELENVIERAVICARGGSLALQPLTRQGVVPARARSTAPAAPSTLTGALGHLKEEERALVADALERSRGKIYGPGGAAALLGIKPTTLSSKIQRLGLRRRGASPARP